MKLTCVIPEALYMRGDFSRFPKSQKAAVLAKHRITAVVCLYGQPDLELRQLMENRGRYIFRRIGDGKTLPEPPLEDLARQLACRVRAGKGAVLVHCRAGRNRSGLLAALVVRELRRCTGKEALHQVRLRRPNAVANPAFEAYLEGLPTP